MSEAYLAYNFHWGDFPQEKWPFIIREYLDYGIEHFVFSDQLIRKCLDEPEFLDYMKSLCAEYGVHFVAMHAICGRNDDLNIIEQEQRPRMIAEHIRSLQIAADFGVKTYTVHPGAYFHVVPQYHTPLEILRRNTLEALDAMVPVAENITITADNYIEFDIDHCSQYIVVKGALASLDITPDNGSSGSGNSSDGGSSSSGGSSSGNSSSSNSNSSSTSSAESTSTWTPKTPDEIKRYSVVGTEILAPFVDKSSGYTLTLKNAMQGPICYAAFESVLNGYTIGRTYDIFPNGQRVQSTDKEVGFSIEVPKALQKDGRTFQMICVTKGGKPVVLKDLDSNPNTVTVKTNKFYAFALVYKDTTKTK